MKGQDESILMMMMLSGANGSASASLEYAAFTVNAVPVTLKLGLAPIATTSNAAGRVDNAVDVTYEILPADVGAVSFSATDIVTTFHNKLDGTVSASLNGGQLFDSIFTGVTIDLKVVYYTDGLESDVTVDKSTITDETFYKYVTPVTEHRYIFTNSNASDSGVGTTANGANNFTPIYDGKKMTLDGTSYITIAATPLSTGAATITSVTSIIDVASLASGVNAVYSAKTKWFFSLITDTVIGTYITEVGGGSVDTTVARAANDGLIVLCTEMDRAGLKARTYINGLMMKEVAWDGTTINNLGIHEAIGARDFVFPSHNLDGDIHGVFLSKVANSLTAANQVLMYNDLVKSGKVSQDYTDWNGKSRIVNVRTTPLKSDEFTTVQAAVNALEAGGNETIVVYDGVSLTPAVGLPANAQVINTVPTIANWEAFT